MAADNKKLIKELTGLLSQIDTEGLLYLKQQAGVIIHNQAVNELNDARAMVPAGKKAPAKTAAKKAPAKKPPVGIHVEQSGKNFIIVTEKSRSFFSLAEIKSLVRICEQTDSKTAGAALYLWMKKERGDFLSNAGIAMPMDAKMVQLAQYLRDNFSSGR
jgi:hypothetical protein